MNYENLFYALGGIFAFEIIISFTAYDAIYMIQKELTKNFFFLFTFSLKNI